MKPRHLFWGSAFLSAGILLLINQVGKVNLHAENLYKFWPLMLVFIGVVYLVQNDKLKGIFAGLAGLTLGLVFYSATHRDWVPFHWQEDHKETSGKVKHYEHPYDKSIKEFDIELKAGAGNFTIIPDSTLLVKISHPEEITRFNIDTSFESGKAAVKVSMDDVNIKFDSDKQVHNGLFLRLHPAPVYSFNIEIGAASANFDLSKFLMRDSRIEVAAASMNLRLGTPADSSNDIDLETGVSSVALYIPKSVGVRLETDMGLSSKHFDGFTEKEEDVYLSENYASSRKKFIIKINGGVSSLSVNRF